MATNVNVKVEGTKLIIEINLNEEHGPSHTGKTTIIASTHGAIKLPGGESVNLNVYKSRR